MKKNARCNGRRFLLPIGIASAAGPPEQKEGVWSIHRQSIDHPGSQKTSTICRSHAYDAYTLSLVKNKKVGCTTLKEDWQGSNYSAESRGIVAGTAVDSLGTVSYTANIGALRDPCQVHSSARRRQRDHYDYGPEVCRQLSGRNPARRFDRRGRTINSLLETLNDD